jgi:hypothetical protein
MLHGLTAIGLLDLGLGSVPRNAQYFVIVSFGHGVSVSRLASMI